MALQKLVLTTTNTTGSWSTLKDFDGGEGSVAIVGVVITNTHTAAIDVGLRIDQGGTSTNYLYIVPITSLAAGDSIYLNTKVFIESGSDDILEYHASTADKVTFIVSADF